MNAFRQRAEMRRRRRIPGSQSSVAPSVDLHIEELILHGFSPGDRYAIGDALERELTRLIAEHGVPGLDGAGFSAERLDVGSFEIGRRARADDVGYKVAESVYRGFCNELDAKRAGERA